MPLRPQVVSLPPIGSIDARTDDKLVRHPRVLQQQNVEFTGGNVNRRNSFRSTSDATAPAFERGGGLKSVDLTMLCQTRKKVLRADGPTSHAWFDTAFASDGWLFVSYMRYNSAFTEYEWRVACLDPYTLEQQNDWDEETPLTTPTGTPAYICGRDDSVVAIWADGSDIKVAQTFVPDGGFSSVTTLLTDHSRHLAVACQSTVYAWIAYVNTSAEVVVYRMSLSSLSASLQATESTDAVALGIYYSEQHNNAYFAGADFSSGSWISQVGGTAVSLEPTHGVDIDNIAVGETVLSSRIVVVYTYEDASQPRLQAFGLPGDLSSVDLSHEAMGHYLASEIIYYKNRPVFVVGWAPDPVAGTVGTDYAETGTAFLCTLERESGQGFQFEPLAVMGQNISVHRPAEHHLCAIATDDDDRLWWAGRNYVAPRTFDGDFSTGAATQTDLSLYTFDFRTHRLANNVRANGMQVIAGGLPMMYDGVDYETMGPLHAPWIYDIILSSASGSLPGSTDLQYIAVYEMFDAKGRVWRSAPSLPVSINTGTDDTAEVEVYVPVCRIKGNSRYPIRVILYRTTASSTIFRRATPHTVEAGVASVVDADWNVQSDPWVGVTDQKSDADIAENEQLYTTGNVIEDHPAPPCVTVEVHRRRLWAVDSETGNIWFSKLFVPGEGIRFALAFQAQNPHTEIPTALVSTESSLLVFYPNRIGQIFGDGPNDLGGGGEFSEIEFLPSQSIGAISQRLTEPTAIGVFFLDGTQGPMLLPYGGAPQSIANDSLQLGSFSEDDWRGIAWLEDRNEVRFTKNDATWHTYHIDEQAWSTGSLPVSGLDMKQVTTVEGRYHVMLAESLAYGDGFPDEFTTSIVSPDDDQIYETGWITLANLPGVQGHFRLWDIYLLGITQAGVPVELAYNFDDNDTYTATTVSAGGFLSTVYTQRIRPNKQRIDALKIKITHSSFSLSEIQLHFGVPGGKGKKPWASPRELGGG